MLLSSLIVVVLTLLLDWITPAVGGNSCGTDQNPYCKGNSALEQLCCPFPNVCYWQNGNGQPACCPAGQNCDGNYPYFTPTPTTTWVTTPTPIVVTTSCTTTTPNVITTTTWNNCHLCGTVTSAVVPVYTTVTANNPQAYTTVNGVIVVNSAPRSDFSTMLTAMLAALSALVCSLFGV